MCHIVPCIFFLSHACASVNDLLSIKTDTTLDLDCVLKATVQVCTACMIVSWLTTCMNFNTPPLAQVAPLRCKIRESNVEVKLETKFSKHVCQLILVCTTQRFQLHLDYSRVSKGSPRLVYKHSMVPTKCLLFLSSSRFIRL